MALGGGQDGELGRLSGQWFSLTDHLLGLQ